MPGRRRLNRERLSPPGRGLIVRSSRNWQRNRASFCGTICRRSSPPARTPRSASAVEPPAGFLREIAQSVVEGDTVRLSLLPSRRGHLATKPSQVALDCQTAERRRRGSANFVHIEKHSEGTATRCCWHAWTHSLLFPMCSCATSRQLARESKIPQVIDFAGDFLVAGVCNHLNLLYFSKGYPLLTQMAAAYRNGLFRTAA